MKPPETSQCYISLEELLDEADRDDLHFDIVNKFNRALNTRDRTPDQSDDEADDESDDEADDESDDEADDESDDEADEADEADDQKGAESSRSRPGTGPGQSTEGQQLDAEGQRLADKLDELW
ncbi:hypothetical protein FMEXI_4971 [Fusarium mexicanum]|uniref:Uncharacterized protein n=1 Tax=Fusarium mexicanum TaxID=751941 RepID=A0A8H5N1F4_9HYPO|nr:hypothetical protein FMEXI_4971 [Fusarium mexicanum]